MRIKNTIIFSLISSFFLIFLISIWKILATLQGLNINSFNIEILNPLDSSKAPMEAAAIPLPREETTPPVIKMYLVLAIIKDHHDGYTA